MVNIYYEHIQSINKSIHTSITNTDKSKSAVGAYWEVKQYQVNQEKFKAIAVRKTDKGMLLTVWYLWR